MVWGVINCVNFESNRVKRAMIPREDGGIVPYMILAVPLIKEHSRNLVDIEFYGAKNTAPFRNMPQESVT